jgi:hypothetical protein
MDGDGAGRGDLAACIVEPIRHGKYAFVIASRARGKREPGSMGLAPAAGRYLVGMSVRALYGMHYTDMCAYRAIRRDCLDRLRMREMTYGWNIEMQMKATRSGLRILEVPMPYRRRSGGESKVAGNVSGSLRAGWRIMATFLRVAATPAHDHSRGRLMTQ